MKPIWPSRRVTVMPAGMTTAWTSRWTVTGSFWWERMSLLGGDGLALFGQRGFEGVPAQARAFHAGREFAYAGEGCEFAELDVGTGFTGSEQGVDGVEVAVHVRQRTAFQRFRHQRS